MTALSRRSFISAALASFAAATPALAVVAPSDNISRNGDKQAAYIDELLAKTPMGDDCESAIDTDEMQSFINNTFDFTSGGLNVTQADAAWKQAARASVKLFQQSVNTFDAIECIGKQLVMTRPFTVIPGTSTQHAGFRRDGKSYIVRSNDNFLIEMQAAMKTPRGFSVRQACTLTPA